MFYRGTLIKRIKLNGEECVDIVGRRDGTFQFIHRKPCNDNIGAATTFESSPYISVETAEAAVSQKFKLEQSR